MENNTRGPAPARPESPTLGNTDWRTSRLPKSFFLKPHKRLPPPRLHTPSIPPNTKISPGTVSPTLDSEFSSLLTTSPSTSRPPNTKTIFSTLPAELRLQIWSHLIPPPRNLRLGLKPKHHTTYSLSQPLVPVILHINHESRTFALSIFRLGFSSSPSPHHQKPKTYWNPTHDTLYLPSWNPPPHHDPRQSYDFEEWAFDPISPMLPNDTFFASTLHHQLISLVQHLALPWDFRTATSLALRPVSDSDLSLSDDPDEDGMAWLPEWLKGFGELKSLMLLVDEKPQWYRAGEMAVEEVDGGRVLEMWSECFRSQRGRGATNFLALPGDIERVVGWRLEKVWGEKGKGMEVPRVKVVIVRKERLEREEGLLEQPIPMRPARLHLGGLRHPGEFAWSSSSWT